eukprot:2201566-Rhodomonas_salina.2
MSRTVRCAVPMLIEHPTLPVLSSIGEPLNTTFNVTGGETLFVLPLSLLFCFYCRGGIGLNVETGAEGERQRQRQRQKDREKHTHTLKRLTDGRRRGAGTEAVSARTVPARRCAL